MGGVAPHTTPVCAHQASLGTICAASWRVGAGSLVLRGPHGGRRLGRGGGLRLGSSLGRGGTIPPASGAGGRGPSGPRASGGAGGGVSRRGPPAPLLGGGLRYSILAPFVSPARSLPACACGRGRSAAPGWGGVRGGPQTAPPGALADLNPPSALPEWAVVTGGSCGGRPQYCSVVGVAPARQCGLAGAGPAAAPPTASPPRLQGGQRAALVAPQPGGVRGGGGQGGPLVPWRCLLTAGGGGGMAVLAPVASHRLGGRALFPPPST